MTWLAWFHQNSSTTNLYLELVNGFPSTSRRTRGWFCSTEKWGFCFKYFLISKVVDGQQVAEVAVNGFPSTSRWTTWWFCSTDFFGENFLSIKLLKRFCDVVGLVWFRRRTVDEFWILVKNFLSTKLLKKDLMTSLVKQILVNGQQISKIVRRISKFRNCSKANHIYGIGRRIFSENL